MLNGGLQDPQDAIPVDAAGQVHMPTAEPSEEPEPQPAGPAQVPTQAPHQPMQELGLEEEETTCDCDVHGNPKGDGVSSISQAKFDACPFCSQAKEYEIEFGVLPF